MSFPTRSSITPGGGLTPSATARAATALSVTTWGRPRFTSTSPTPYDPQLRRELIAAAQSLGIDVTPSATYAATQGPRLETAAEIRRLARDGCDVVGMTGMPEAALAAELGLRYASVCLVVNPAAGLGDGPIDEAAMRAVLERNMAVIAALLGRWVESGGRA